MLDLPTISAIEFMQANRTGFAHPREASAAVARYLPHRAAPADSAGIEKNCRVRDGRWHWHWDPELLLSAPQLLLNVQVACLQSAANAGTLRDDLDLKALGEAISTACTGAAHQWTAKLIDDRALRRRCQTAVDLAFAAAAHRQTTLLTT